MFKYSPRKSVLTVLLVCSSIAVGRNYTQAQVNISSDRLIADADSQFTQSMADALIDYGEFLAGDDFTPAQKTWLIETETANFQNNPQKLIDYTDKLNSEIFPEIEALKSDPVQLSRYREKAFADIYLDRSKNETLNRQDFMTVVYQYIPVIMLSEEEELVVTLQDIDASLASDNFVRNLNPIYKNYYEHNYVRGKYDYDNGDRNERLVSVKENFSRFDDRLQKSIAYAESRWYGLSWGWNNSSSEEKQNIAAEVALRKANHERFSTITHSLEDRFYYTAEEKAE